MSGLFGCGLCILFIQLLLKPLVLFCDEQTPLYGILLVKSGDKMTVSYYSYSQKNDNHSKYTSELIYNEFDCESKDIEKCVNRKKQSSQLSHIPNNKIFFKLFNTVDTNQPNINNRETDELADSRTSGDSSKEIQLKAAEKYLTIEGVKSEQVYDRKTADFFTFGLTNIDTKNQIIKPDVSLVIGGEVFFLGYPTENNLSHPKSLLYQAIYRKKDYSVVANNFFCASPTEINYLIYYLLTKISPIRTKIPHPCLPRNTFVTLNNQNNNGKCVHRLEHTDSVSFVGAFDEEVCKILIEKAVTQHVLKSDPLKKPNFDGIQLPLQVNPAKNLQIYVPWLKQNKIEGDISKSLQDIQKKLCDEAKVPTMVNITANECLEITYLRYVIERVLHYTGNSIELNKLPSVFLSNQKMVFGDPRIGLTLNEESKTDSETVNSASDPRNPISAPSDMDEIHTRGPPTSEPKMDRPSFGHPLPGSGEGEGGKKAGDEGDDDDNDSSTSAEPGTSDQPRSMTHNQKVGLGVGVTLGCLVVLGGGIGIYLKMKKDSSRNA